MEYEADLIDSLNALRYQGACIDKNVLSAALSGGPRHQEFRNVVGWLAKELHVLRKTDEGVDKEVSDPNEFAMELSALLKELGCPYEKFITGALSDRFSTKLACAELLDYMITELMAIKMRLHIKPDEELKKQSYVIATSETSTAKLLEQLTKNLNLGKPPENIAPKALFDKTNFKLEELIRKVDSKIVSEPLLKLPKLLTEAQWKKLERIHADLDTEYNLRRQVLITRLEVTVQSFQWSDKMKQRQNEILERFQQKLVELEKLRYCGKETDIAALLAARSDMAIIEKTSSANVRKNTAAKVQKHIIGSVPDRGGRANEHAPPPPEMPSWQQQRSGGPGGGGNRGGFQGNRGGFQGNRGGGGSGGGGFQGGKRDSYSGGGGGDRNFNSSGGGGGGYNNAGANRNNSGNFGNGNINNSGNFGNSGYTGGSGGGGGGWQAYAERHQNAQQNQNWISGSGRVQGTGWAQGNPSDGNYKQHNQGNNRDGGYRGRSNYNRGGGQRR